MKNYLLAILCFFSTQVLYAQSLEYIYDVEADTFCFLKNGVKVVKPTIKPGENLLIHVKNYNDYLYDLDVQVQEKSYEIPSSGQSIFGGFGMGAGEGFGAVFNPRGMGDFDPSGLAWFSSDEDDEEPDDRKGGGTSLLVQAKKDFNQILETVQAEESKLVALATEIQDELNSLQLIQLAESEVNRIKTTPGLKPSQIDQLSREFLVAVKPDPSNPSSSLANLIEMQDPKTPIAKKINAYDLALQNIESQIIRSKEIAQQISLDSGEDEMDELIRQFIAFENLENNRVEFFEEGKANMEGRLDQVDEISIRDLLNLRYMYEEMASHTYSTKYPVAIHEDQAKIEINLVPKDSARILKSLTTNKISTFNLQTHGGIRINSSLGISFAGLFESPMDYFIRDSIIVGERRDKFYPMLSNFYHFYSQGSGNVSFGGSLGIGLAISTDNAIQSASFFLGPSIIIGRDQRIVVSTGIMGTKVQRLAEGFKEGDILISEVNNVPTKNIYDYGYFLGLSFNLF